MSARAEMRRVGPFFVLVGALGCGVPDPAPPPAPATFAGRAACAGCHAVEDALWQGSHHDLAMEAATDQTVLGDFSGTSFFRRDGEFFVRADGPDGAPADFRVDYTFGAVPLQQYLVAFPRGRYQVLRSSWDARPAEAGGQRWFELYPGETIDHRDPLHWTGPQQNWNYMCAECHSTGLRRGYIAAEDRFETSWTEIDVSCEACHGPGSNHVAWAREAAATDGDDPARGLMLDLSDTSGGAWRFDGVEPTARRTAPRSSDAQLETCARCHSRRGWVWEDYRPGEPLAQTHRVALLEAGLYHDDGQILDEVYEYGSFLQSRMHAAGVTCTDCHDPHSGRPVLEGNALCGRCHLPASFDVEAHHHHPPDSAGASCVACHMPEREFMVIDPRRDHGLFVPRPDLAVTLGTPEPCTGCHAGQDAAWAARQVAAWFPQGRAGRFHHGEAFHAARSGRPEAPDLLSRVFGDAALPAIVRATALLEMPRARVPDLPGVIETAAGDTDPLVRRTAAEVAAALDPTRRAHAMGRLLGDPIRTVRLAAASSLAGVPAETLGPASASLLAPAVEEYRASLRFDEFRADARFNLGNLERRLGRVVEAEAAYRQSLSLDPSFVPAYVNLATLLGDQERLGDALELLRRGLTENDGSADLHHALGLSLVRARRLAEALEHLRVAAELRPDSARYAVVYGVALHDAGDRSRALRVLDEAAALHPLDPGPREALRAYRSQEETSE